eukprot:TRINITY_DN57573_c0_g1_i1.p2 TRINITY_DN57573_c0_g1~~TRINITY_DN57573_c0_g1_i1.p2  ORF type:complete len:100 (+),score=25.16 TRINITY_DN57573_c0_g1_i1:150-449(+)
MCIRDRSGGSGQYGKIDYKIRPGEPNTGFTFSSSVVGGNVPKEFFPAIEKGFKSMTVSYTHLRAHETPEHLVCRLLLEKKKKKIETHISTNIQQIKKDQ